MDSLLRPSHAIGLATDSGHVDVVDIVVGIT